MNLDPTAIDNRISSLFRVFQIRTLKEIKLAIDFTEWLKVDDGISQNNKFSGLFYAYEFLIRYCYTRDDTMNYNCEVFPLPENAPANVSCPPKVSLDYLNDQVNFLFTHCVVDRSKILTYVVQSPNLRTLRDTPYFPQPSINHSEN